MGKAENVLQLMESKGLRLSIVSGQVRCRAPRHALTSTEVMLIREAESDLKSTLMGLPAFATTSSINLAPLTFTQRWTWELIQVDKATNELNSLYYSFLLEGVLDVEVLSESFSALVRRHESLRTRIAVIDGTPKQQIDEPGPFRLQVMYAMPGVALGELLRDIAAQQIDLIAGPLFQPRLLRIADRKHVLIIGIHHLVSDGESIAILLRELWSLYRAGLKGDVCSLPETMQYADHVAWVRANARAHEGYWQSKIEAAARIKWPVDSELKYSMPNEVGMLHMSLGPELVAAIRAVAREQKTAPAMIVLAVWAVLVWRWCGQSDFMLSFNVNGRADPRRANTIGCLAYPLYLRMVITGGEAFTDVIKFVSAEFLSADEHSDFGRLFLEAPHFYSGGSFQYFCMESRERAFVASEWDDVDRPLRINNVPIEKPLPDAAELKFADLGLALYLSEQELHCGARYRTDLFLSSMMQGLMTDWKSILHAFTRDPTLRLSSLRSFGSLSTKR